MFSFGAHSQIFLVGGSSLSTEAPEKSVADPAAQPKRQLEIAVSLKFHCLELPRKVSLSFIGNEFRSVTQSFQTRVLHEVALLVFCGILASFLA